MHSLPSRVEPLSEEQAAELRRLAGQPSRPTLPELRAFFAGLSGEQLLGLILATFPIARTLPGIAPDKRSPPSASS